MRKPFELLKNRKALVGVEVGVSEGRNAFDILKGLDIKTLYLVDIWGEYHEEESTLNSIELEKASRDNLKEFKDKIVFIKKTSVGASGDFEDNSLDFVYIDANHQYEFVKEDIEAWWPKVKINGMLAGDDLNRVGVNQAVRERFGTHYPKAPFEGKESNWYEYKM